MKKTKTLFILLFFTFFLITTVFARRRYFSDAEELSKIPKLLIYPLFNFDPSKRKPELSNKIPEDMIAKFSTSSVEAKTKDSLTKFRIKDLANPNNIQDIQTAAKAYKTDFIMVGEYRAFVDLDTRKEKIIIKIAVYDVKINRTLFTIESMGFMGIGYHNLLEVLTMKIQKKLDRYKKNMDEILRKLLKGKPSPLNDNKKLVVGILSHPMDPTWIPRKGVFAIANNAYFSYLDLDFTSDHMVSETLGDEISFSYAISGTFLIGLRLDLIYWSKTESDNSMGYYSKTTTGFANPGLFFKIKLAEKVKHDFNLSFSLYFAPNLSSKTLGDSEIVTQFNKYYGTLKVKFAISNVFKKIIPYFNLEFWMQHYLKDFYAPDNKANVKGNKVAWTIYAELGSIFQVTRKFLIDFKIIVKHQYKTTLLVNSDFSPPGDYTSQSIFYKSPAVGSQIGFYFIPDNSIYIGLNLKYYFPFKFTNENPFGKDDTKITNWMVINFSVIFKFNML